MKKFLIAFLLVFLVQIPQYSLAKTETVHVVSDHSTSDKKIIKYSDPGFYTAHANKWCGKCSKTHCLICHKDHYAEGGEFTKEPECECHSKIKNGSGSAPSGSGWTKSEEWYSKEYTCGNDMPGQRVSAVTCSWKVTTYTRTIPDECNDHPTTCINDDKPASAHGTGTLSSREIYMYKTYKCEKCGKNYQRPVCKAKNAPSPSSDCVHGAICKEHKKTQSQHPIDGYYWSSDPVESSRCSICGQIRVYECKKKSSTIDPVEPECDHECGSELEPGDHDHGGPDTGEEVTAKDIRFGSTLDKSEETRIKNPVVLGDGKTFTLTVNSHMDGDVDQDVTEEAWGPCQARDKYVCKDCGVVLSEGEVCNEKGTTYHYGDAEITDTYHNVVVEFVGFKANGKTRFDFYEKNTYSATKQKELVSKEGSSVYTITELIPKDLKEDDGKWGDKSSGLWSEGEKSGSSVGRWPEHNIGWRDRWGNIIQLPGRRDLGSGGTSTDTSSDRTIEKTGLVYGVIKVRCDCNGCRGKSDEYRIYFDLTPDNPYNPAEDKYTLTVKAEGFPEKGGVSIGSTEEYSGYAQEKLQIDAKTYIYAEGKTGYRFDGWYKTDESKYSAGDESNGKTLVSMPGYDLTLIAKFLPQDRYNIRVYSDGNGDVKFDGRYDTGEEGWEVATNVIKGDNIDVVAKPYEGFAVEYWELIKGDGNDFGNEEKITISNVSEDYIIYVHFKPSNTQGYKRFSTRANGPGTAIGGTRYAIPGNYYPIWALPDEEAYFWYWKDEDESKITEFGRIDTVKMPDKNYELTAYFNNSESDYYQVVVESDGNGEISIGEGDRKSRETATVKDGTTIIINAFPNDEFKFRNWTDDEGNVISGGEVNSVTIDEDKTYIAHFDYIGDGITYNLNVESAGGGKVYGNVENAIPGTEYHIRAVPDENCEFLYWMAYWTDIDGVRNDEITCYTQSDYIIMPENDLTLVAHFRETNEIEETFTLKVKIVGEGTVNGKSADFSETHYFDEPVEIEIEADAGYEIEGIYEGTGLLSRGDSGNYGFYMPARDMTIVVRFREIDDDAWKAPFKILSIRDIRWKDYFTSNKSATNAELFVPYGADQDTILVNEAELLDEDYKKYVDIVYGYAVEFELVTANVKESESKLYIEAELYEKTESEAMNKINLDLGDYGKIDSSDPDDVKRFMITHSQEDVVTTVGDVVITNPIVTWRWVWYLPLDIREDICQKVDDEQKSKVVVKFRVYVQAKDGETKAKTDYVRVINALDRYGNTSWGGNVFTYRLDKTLEDDIYNNANN